MPGGTDSPGVTTACGYRDVDSSCDAGSNDALPSHEAGERFSDEARNGENGKLKMDREMEDDIEG